MKAEILGYLFIDLNFELVSFIACHLFAYFNIYGFQLYTVQKCIFKMILTR